MRRLRLSGDWLTSTDVWMLGVSLERPWRLAWLFGVYVGPWCWSLAIEWLPRRTPPAVPSTTDQDLLLRRVLAGYDTTKDPPC